MQVRGSCKKFCHWVWITSMLHFIKHIFITNLQSIPSLPKHIFVTFLPSREKQIYRYLLVSVGDTAGWPRTLEKKENRENGEKNSLQGKIREFEILLKIREKSGNFKKSYLCKVKIFKFYSCSDVATGSFFLPYA